METMYPLCACAIVAVVAAGKAIEKAHLALPDAPGYGIELDDAKVEGRRMMHWS